ncbi:DNA alkylation repair protein, partial [Rhizobiaceae sp. 2RAB30]
KKGDPRALALIGAGGKAEVKVDDFAVAPAAITLGQRIRMDARLVSTSDEPQRLVVDYAVHYVKKGGSPSRKVFKLKTVDLAPGAACDLAVGQTIRDFTTRKHYPGRHRVELMVNGETLAEGNFDLVI